MAPLSGFLGVAYLRGCFTIDTHAGPPRRGTGGLATAHPVRIVRQSVQPARRRASASPSLRTKQHAVQPALEKSGDLHVAHSTSSMGTLCSMMTLRRLSILDVSTASRRCRQSSSIGRVTSAAGPGGRIPRKSRTNRASSAVTVSICVLATSTVNSACSAERSSRSIVYALALTAESFFFSAFLSAGVVRPKYKKPFQTVPVTSLAIADSDRYSSPL